MKKNNSIPKNKPGAAQQELDAARDLLAKLDKLAADFEDGFPEDDDGLDLDGIMRDISRRKGKS